MLKTLLVRGMIVGVIAGLLGFGMAKIYGEPQVDKAIAFETWLDQQKEKAAEAQNQAATANTNAATTNGSSMAGMPGMNQQGQGGGDEELVSRPVQASWGLLTAVLVYGASMGGIFALVYAFALGRFTGVSPRGLAALLALAAFITIALIPDLKYPANPPSVGNPDTIGPRTGLYLSMLVISIGAMVSAILTGRSLYPKHGLWTAVIAGGVLYLVIVFVAEALLPDVQEVPDQFPAVVLWRFRVANLGIQTVIWTSMGLLFGYLTERSFQASRAVLRPAE
ncbi:MAG TPA: CbtA family protein [Dongiaceae bacterium]|jgi:predicted cobalt transporter CbtA|nr:CbtA family protein [Dongiaceae bacterium]